MSNDTALKLEGTNGDLQQFSSSEENYLAYVVGQFNLAGTSEDIGDITLTSTSNHLVGDFVDNFYNEPVGTHPASSISSGSTTTNLYQVAGTSSPSTGALTPISYDLDSDGDPSLFEMTNADLTVLADRLNSRIATSDYSGIYALGSSPPSGDYSVHLSNVFSDTQTDGTTVNYNIYQRTTMAAPTTTRPVGLRSDGDLQEMSDSDIADTVGAYVRTRRVNGGIGSYQLRSSGEGTPTDPGTWKAVGTATDTQKDLVETGYTRNRSSAFSRNRVTNFAGDFVGNYSRNFGGNFVGNYSRNFGGNFVGNYARNFTGNFTGNYSRNFVGNFFGNYSRTRTRSSTRTSTRTVTGFYTGNFTGNFTGNYARSQMYFRNSATSSTQSFTRFVQTSFRNSATSRQQGYVRFTGPPQFEPLLFTRNFFGNFTGEFFSAQSYSRTFFGNFTGNFFRTVFYNRVDTRTSTRTSTLNFTGNFGGNFFGNFVGNYNRSRATSFFGNFTRNRATNFAGNFTRTSTRTSTRNFTRTSTRTSSRNFTRDRVTNFAGDFIGNYSRNIVDTFVGTTIGSGSSVIDTYTLYVRTA